MIHVSRSPLFPPPAESTCHLGLEDAPGEHSFVHGIAHRISRRSPHRPHRHESIALLLSSHPAAREAAAAVLDAVRLAFRPEAAPT